MFPYLETWKEYEVSPLRSHVKFHLMSLSHKKQFNEGLKVVQLVKQQPFFW